MRGHDPISDALDHALRQSGGPNPPVAVLNATGQEDVTWAKFADHKCNKCKNTIEGVFNTILVRATRQIDETLGLIARATSHAGSVARLFVAQENSHGAQGLEKRLKQAWPNFDTVIKHKCRVMILDPSAADPAVLGAWQAGAALRHHPDTGFWTAPGLFSWDRLDKASTLLLAHLPTSMAGVGADLGCGYGYLSVNLVQKQGTKALYSLDWDIKAVESCQKNLENTSKGVEFHVIWADLTQNSPDIPKLDWVVMNPPFHDRQSENRALGQKFCTTAMKMLKSGGRLYLVANRHMPYEAILEASAKKVECLAEKEGFKILVAEAP